MYIENFQIGRLQTDADLGSHGNFEIANQWLRVCRSSHPNCLLGSVPELPPRVIDVGKIDGSEKPRLVHSRGSKAEYVALSHCWGGRISPLLNTDTLATFQEEIPYAALSANFQDVITIARQLDIQYLWIDSLCIIQDSKRDWELESKRMGQVYRDSAVTISALASRGSTDGILKTASDAVLCPKQSSMRIFKSNEEHMEVAVQRQEVEEESLKRLHLYAPLCKRGWTLQESMLSPRQLYYGTCQMYWKCPNGCASADGAPPGFRTLEDTYDKLSSVFYSDILRHPQSGLCSIDAILVDYYTLVTEYSSRMLTFDSDKLPAFCGLAQRLHPALGGDYLAGLWSSDLIRGFLWYREMTACKHVEPYRAPSWSWAVTNDSILIRTDPPGPGPWGMQLIDYKIILRDRSNPYGEIASGHLVIEALTMPLFRSNQVVESVSPDDDIGGVYFDEPKGITADFNASSLFLVRGSSGTYLLSILTKYGKSRSWDIDFDSFYPERYTAVVVHGSEDNVQGLVLESLSEPPNGVYKRTGHFIISEKTSEPRSEWIQNLMRETLTLV